MFQNLDTCLGELSQWLSCIYFRIISYSRLPRWHYWLKKQKTTCQCRRRKRWELDPWVKKISWRRKWQPVLVFLPGESHGQRSLVGCSPQGRNKLGMTEVTAQYNILVKKQTSDLCTDQKWLAEIPSQETGNTFCSKWKYFKWFVKWIFITMKLMLNRKSLRAN